MRYRTTAAPVTAKSRANPRRQAAASTAATQSQVPLRQYQYQDRRPPTGGRRSGRPGAVRPAIGGIDSDRDIPEHVACFLYAAIRVLQVDERISVAVGTLLPYEKVCRTRLDPHGATGAALTTASLFWGLLFGSIGFGFFVYGKKQQKPVPLACGLALMVFPYFISNTFALVGIGAALMAVPYFVRV